MTKQKLAIAVNGSPRKGRNTDTLLQKALDGAKSVGAATRTIHLYDLAFRGCVSCFSCKRVETYRDGRCAMRDDLSPVLEEVMKADALFLGSPIYLSDVTGEMRSFMERLLFMNATYDSQELSIFKGSISCGFIYTMGVPLDMMNEWGYPKIFESHMTFLKLLNGRTEYIAANDTYQFDDYSKYHAPRFDEAHKREVRERDFPKDCERAFEMGARLAG
ncbi:flavodoxin family protein [Synergistaceae bacterium OttesenSCG-928-I11]|nr:flavodoxin family protein [Synergistaceae bacterium OttesenSCG-928-I11]